MATTAETDRYSRGAIAFHWIIAALIIFNLYVGLFGETLPGDWKLMPAHKAVGMTVLVLGVARLGWRLGHRPPPFPAGMPAWERGAAKAVHWLFYTLMIALPLSGWMMVSGAEQRRPFDWFGLFPIPFLPLGRDAGASGHAAHEILGYAMVALLILHVLAALRHHLVLRDATLVRMLPILRLSNH